MGKLFNKFADIIREDDDDEYEYDEDGNIIYQEPVTLEDAFNEFLGELDRRFRRKGKEDTVDDDELPQFDENGKRIVYVYDKDFYPGKYKTKLDINIKQHPDSDELPDLDVNYSDLNSDSDKIIKFKK